MRMLSFAILILCINASFAMIDQLGLFETSQSSTNNPILKFNETQVNELYSYEQPQVDQDLQYDPSTGQQILNSIRAVGSFLIAVF